MKCYITYVTLEYHELEELTETHALLFAIGVTPTNFFYLLQELKDQVHDGIRYVLSETMVLGIIK